MKTEISDKTFLVIDIGSIQVSSAIGSYQDAIEKNPKILGYGFCKSRGIKKGIISNILEASEAVKESISSSSRTAGIKVNEATVSISSAYTKSILSHGIVNIVDSEISINEIKRSIDTALYNAQVHSDYKVIHVLPYMFKVDEHDNIDDPIGMNGSRLEAFVYVVTAKRSAISNLEKVIQKSGISIKNFVLDGYATSLVVVKKEEKDFGVATVNVGGAISSIVVSKGNAICYSDYVPVGSNNITVDISLITQTNIQSAENAKIEHVSLLNSSDLQKTIELSSSGNINNTKPITIAILNQITSARVEELFSLIKQKLIKSKLLENLNAGIILTGGMARIRGIDELANKIFDPFPVRIAKPMNIFEPLINENNTTICGLAMYAFGSCTKYEIDSNKILKYSDKSTKQSTQHLDLKNIITSASESQKVKSKHIDFLKHKENEKDDDGIFVSVKNFFGQLF